MMEQSTSWPAALRRRWLHKRLILPAEHGSWSWLLVPFLVGVLASKEWTVGSTLVLAGGLAAFLLRQPAAAWMRIRSGRGRRSQEPVARAWALSLGLAAALTLLGLLVLDYTQLVWLLPPMVVIFLFYLLVAWRRRASLRSLWMELLGAAALAAMAPAAYGAGAGVLDRAAWVLWALMAGQNVLGVVYVRLRLADTHGRSVNRSGVLAAHAGGLALVTAAAAIGITPWLAVLPFLGFLARAVWAVSEVHPVSNIKRFGFGEVGVEILGGLLVAMGYWLG
ncbi:MAG: YwiC-like family protein [Candidatus Promineifilaceae bacterium]|nr:YwiC-like family protein [Candidatus Promineifilaceae bacterium]